MLISTVVSVVIGLSALYLTFSIFCTALNELLANLVKLRGRMLVRTIGRLIDMPQLRDAFYQHGLISSAALASPGTATPTGAEDGTVLLAAAHLEPANVARALLDSLSAASPPATVEEVRVAVASLPESNIRRVLLSCLASAGADMDALRTQISSWYDVTMKQLSEAFRQRMGLIGLAIGLFMACLLNIDTIQVAEVLLASPDQATRIERLADKALALSEANSVAPTPPTEGTETAPNAEGKDPTEEAISKAISSLNDSMVLLAEFPIGWRGNEMAGNKSWQEWLGYILLKLLGVSITAIAISFGAPRWYEVLALITGRQKPATPDPAP